MSIFSVIASILHGLAKPSTAVKIAGNAATSSPVAVNNSPNYAAPLYQGFVAPKPNIRRPNWPNSDASFPAITNLQNYITSAKQIYSIAESTIASNGFSGIDPMWAVGQAWVETKFDYKAVGTDKAKVNPWTGKTPSYSYGFLQVTPQTAVALYKIGYTRVGQPRQASDLINSSSNIYYWAALHFDNSKYLKRNGYPVTLENLLKMYNGGPKALSGTPNKTVRDYLSRYNLSIAALRDWVSA